MSDEVVRTGVDELLDLLKNNSKIALVDVARKLGISLDVLQAWVDFLVEERILGIEYKFTTPYIYLNKPLEEQKVVSNKNEGPIDLTYFKKQFWEKAKNNNIPESRIADLWKNHLLQELELKKKYFFYEAQTRKILNIEQLWEEYQRSLLSI
ncbi:MAG: hypothetical protein KatS3mg002_0735 [Candidatus Woesearchaeota archaeon]|nr:MAG: hypothetical protein KatS3mg002_0735 [Candidatus Woesearchaeota archaeon]